LHRFHAALLTRPIRREMRYNVYQSAIVCAVPA
jgi:hypothetical protein